MVKKIHTFFIVTLICSFLFPSPVHAQDEKPQWWNNLVCNDKEQHFSGIQYCHGKSPHENFYVTVIQLDSPGIQIEYLIPDGIDAKGKLDECKDVNRSTKLLGGPGCDDPDNRNWYPVMYLDEAVSKAQKESGLAVVINGDYSACTDDDRTFCPLTKDGKLYYREHGPEGLTIVRDSRLDGSKNGDGDNNIVNRPYLVISQSTPVRAELHQSSSDNGLKPYGWAYTGVGGWPWLIQNGEVLEKVITSCENTSGSCRTGASQTAVGITLDNKWMFFVLAVDAPRLLDVADFMDKKLDAWQAMKFDGGGSSQLYYEGAIDENGNPHPYVKKNDKRPLTNFLAIYAQPGKGIYSHDSPEPSGNSQPPSSDDNLSWWQKIQQGWTNFWNGIGNWWNGVQKKFTDLVDGIKALWQDLLNLPQRIQDWFIQQFMNWLTQQINQICGSVGIISMTVAFVAYARRRHRK